MNNGIFYGNLQPDEILAGCINIYNNAWPNPEESINAIEEECLNFESGMNWSRAGTTSHGINQDIRTNYDLGITAHAEYYENKVAQNIHNQMHFILQAAVKGYQIRYGINNLYHEYYNMLKYRGGQKYDSHFDGSSDTGRCVSAICYLNDDYEGGEIEFENFGIKIKPKSGMLLLFPSNYAYSHIAHPVISGTKYAIVTWLADRIVQ
jgi:hypothetical protein